MSETPRTDELKRGIWRLMQSQGREQAYAWRDAIHCGIEQLERELAALREQLAERDAEVSDYKCRAQMNADAIQHYNERAEKATAECEHWKKNAASCHIERDVHAAMIERAEKAEAQLAERDAEIAALKGHAVEPRIGLNSDGSLDEVVGSPGHIEQLDSGHWFVEIGEYAIWLHANGKIVAHYEHRAAYPKED